MDLYTINLYSLNGGSSITRYIPASSPEGVYDEFVKRYPDLAARNYQHEIEKFEVEGYRLVVVPEHVEGIFLGIDDAYDLFGAVKNGHKRLALGRLKGEFKRQMKAQLPQGIENFEEEIGEIVE